MQLKRLMALDYGDVRIVVAVSDLTKTIASGLETYKWKNLEQELNHFAFLAQEQNVEKFIIGLPLNMDGSEGPRAEKTRAFGDKLSELTGLVVEYVDERLTSVEAEEILISAGLKREKRKEGIDKLGATLILKSYLKI